MPTTDKKDKMSANELVRRLEQEFAQDEWKEATQAESGDFNGPDGKYYVRLGKIFYGNTKGSDLYFSYGLYVADGPHKGQMLRKMVVVKDTKNRSKNECIQEVMADFKLMGAQGVAGSPIQEFPKFVDDLNDLKPTFWVKTNTSRYTRDDGSDAEWLYVTVLGDVDEHASSPSAFSSPSQEAESFDARSSWPSLLAGANVGDRHAISEIARRAKEVGVDPENASLPTWVDVADAVQQASAPKPSSTPSPKPSSSPTTSRDWASLGVKAEDGDSHAQLELEDAAGSAGLDAASFPTWKGLAAALAHSSPSTPSAPPADRNSDDWRPAKGEVYLFAFRQGLDEKLCRVTKVLVKNRTVNLTREEDGHEFADVAWDKLGQLVDAAP